LFDKFIVELKDYGLAGFPWQRFEKIRGLHYAFANHLNIPAQTVPPIPEHNVPVIPVESVPPIPGQGVPLLG